MPTTLVLANDDDIDKLENLYNEAYLFAKTVGDLDWQYPFPVTRLHDMIAKKQLYLIKNNHEKVEAAVRLFTASRYSAKSFYVGKLATHKSVKGTYYTSRILLPAIVDEAQKRNIHELHLTCLAHNNKLLKFYEQLGFVHIETQLATADNGKKVKAAVMVKVI